MGTIPFLSSMTGFYRTILWEHLGVKAKGFYAFFIQLITPHLKVLGLGWLRILGHYECEKCVQILFSLALLFKPKAQKFHCFSFVFLFLHQFVFCIPYTVKFVNCIWGRYNSSCFSFLLTGDHSSSCLLIFTLSFCHCLLSILWHSSHFTL